MNIKLTYLNRFDASYTFKYIYIIKYVTSYKKKNDWKLSNLWKLSNSYYLKIHFLTWPILHSCLKTCFKQSSTERLRTAPHGKLQLSACERLCQPVPVQVTFYPFKHFSQVSKVVALNHGTKYVGSFCESKVTFNFHHLIPVTLSPSTSELYYSTCWALIGF